MGQRRFFALLQGYHAGPRFRKLTELEELWWVRAVDYCATNATDGVLSGRAAKRLVDWTGWAFEGEPVSWETVREHLLASGLVEEHEDGLQLHDFLDHNPSREYWQDLSEKRAAAGKAGAAARWKNADGNDGKPDGKRNGKSMALEHEHVLSSKERTSQASVPGSPPEAKKDSRGTRLPADWQPSPELIARAREAVPSVDLRLETDQFRDWALAASGPVSVKRDWDAAWRTWMRRRHAENLERGWKPAGGAPAQLSEQRAQQQAAIRRARQESFLQARGLSVAEWEKHERAGDTAWLERVRAMAPLEGL